jgi:chromosome segregation ATPase
VCIIVIQAETEVKLLEVQEKLLAAVAEGNEVKDQLAAHKQVVDKLSAELEQGKSNEHAVQATVKNLQQQLEAARSETEIAKSDAVDLKLVRYKAFITDRGRSTLTTILCADNNCELLLSSQ